MQKSTTFLMATLMLFFERDRPDSRQQNPACIEKTKAVQNNSQTVLVAIDCSTCPSHFVAEGHGLPTGYSLVASFITAT